MYCTHFVFPAIITVYNRVYSRTLYVYIVYIYLQYMMYVRPILADEAATRNKTFHECVDDLNVSIFDDLLCVLYLFLFKHCSSRFISFFFIFRRYKIGEDRKL